MKLPMKSSIPMYSCQLPSNDKVVEYRPYVMKEEHVLMLANESGDPEQTTLAVKNLLSACTYNKLDIGSLPIFDLEYLYLMIRAKARGEEVALSMKCNAVGPDGKECGHSNSVSFNIIRDVKVKRTPEHSNKIVFENGSGVIMGYPNITSFMRREEADTLSKQYEVLMTTIVENVETIFNEDGEECSAHNYPIEDIREFLEETLTEKEFIKLKSFFDTMPAVIGEFDFTCKKCKFKHKGIQITGINDFLA
jgi:hypothetical protein